MSIPTWAGAGSSISMTVPYQATSYRWLGNLTSAQYYVNNAGLAIDQGCIWSEANSGKGNWAPLVFGASVAMDGMTYAAILKNPENPEPANFNVKVGFPVPLIFSC